MFVRQTNFCFVSYERIYMKKSCLILSFCIFPSFAFAFNDLPAVKKNIANKLIHCISHPQSDGAAYINICYGEAADEFIRQGNSYVEDRLSKTDAFSSVEDIKKDQVFFNTQIELCSNFPGESIAYGQKLNWVSTCRIYWAKQYAEYFYTPSKKETMQKTRNSSQLQKNFIYKLIL